MAATLSSTDQVAWQRLRREIDAGVPLDTIAQGFGVTTADLMEWVFAYKESATDKADYRRAAEENSRRVRERQRQSFSAIAEMDDRALRNLRDSAATRVNVETERIRRIDSELGRRLDIHGVYP